MASNLLWLAINVPKCQNSRELFVYLTNLTRTLPTLLFESVRYKRDRSRWWRLDNKFEATPLFSISHQMQENSSIYSFIHFNWTR